jgi:hypothetical protein
VSGYDTTRRMTLTLDSTTGFEGATVEVDVAVGWGVLKRVRKLVAGAGGETAAEEEARVDELIELFATEGLLAWNLERHGQPVPPTAEGLGTLEPNLMVSIVGTWAGSIGSVNPPLGKRSPATATSRSSRSRTRKRAAA